MKDNVEAGTGFVPSLEPSKVAKPMTETELNDRIEEQALQQSESHFILIRRENRRF